MPAKDTDKVVAPQKGEYDLVIMRHGPAANRGPAAGDDSTRPLTPEGKEKVRQNARGLVKLGLKLDWIVTSPLVRAAETAEIVADAFDQRISADISDALKPGAAPEALITFLAKHPERRQVLVVGHEPDLSEMAGRLIGAGRHANLSFKKGGCCLIRFTEFPPKSPGELVWWLTPRILRKLA